MPRKVRLYVIQAKKRELVVRVLVELALSGRASRATAAMKEGDMMMMVQEQEEEVEPSVQHWHVKCRTYHIPRF